MGAGHCRGAQKTTGKCLMIKDKTIEKLYSDKLISVTPQTITFYNYYFWGAEKTVLVEDVASIESFKSTLLNGKYRYWGTSGLYGWMPLDWQRSSRDKIFLLHYKNKSFQIGFTVENSALAENAFRQLGLMK
jgi:hypothetical protein